MSAVHLLVAPAGGGKTARVIEHIRALPPLSPVRVLVPDRIEAVAFRRRLAQAGGGIGIQVQTFYDLYADVLTQAGRALPEAAAGAAGMARLPPIVRLRLIQHLAETCFAAGALPYYAPLHRAPGFARLLGQLFGEFKRARIFPHDLERVLAATEPANSQPNRASHLLELARLYSAYQSWLVDTAWVDADGQGWLAAIALERDPTLFSDLALLAVDGFDEFNPTQLHLLHLLADRAQITLITLTGDPHRPERLAHRRFARARTALDAAFAAHLSAATLDRRPPGELPPLAHLEHHLFAGAHADVVPTAPPGDAVAFLEAQNRAAEARAALRWLKARAVRHGTPLSDLAIIARDVAPYRPFLEEAAAEFGMPLRFATGADLSANPAVVALTNVLALPQPPVDWQPQALIDALSSPYLDWSACALQPGDADRLYHAARAGQVLSGGEQWRAALRQLAAVTPTDPPAFDDEDLAPPRPPTGTQAERLAHLFEDLVVQLTPPAEATQREWVAWIEALVGPDPAMTGSTEPDDAASLHVVACARANPTTAERDVAALRALKDVLRGLVLADEILHPAAAARLPAAQFVAELLQALAGNAYTVPVEGEAIAVISAMEARGLTFDAVALLGLAEGDFPRAEREDALLRESDRAWLATQGFPIEQRLHGDEATLFYQVATRARRRLLLCRPYLAEDGQPWEPSPYWFAVRRLFPHAPLCHVRPTDPLVDPASPQELHALQPGVEASLPLAVLNARAQAALSPWNGDLSALRPVLQARFGPHRPWSSSRLETYAKCPFYFWAAYAMELEPREMPEAGFDVLILGSIYHLVLERLYQRVPDGDPARLFAELPAVAQAVYATAPHDYGFRPTPLWERQKEELTDVLRYTLEGLVEAAGDYTPLASELAFGLKDNPPLVLHGPDGSPAMTLRGYIDRVDRAAGGTLRVIDYKSGSTPISPHELEEGRRLQLPLYALAAAQALDAVVSSGFYWHISSAKPSSLRLETYPGGVAGAVDTAVDHALRIGADVQAGQFPAAPPDGGCPRFCPAAAFCAQYKAQGW
ncbi:MAG: PD-(D/E)XK nuclease family protein [Anaerolineae bacterium]|nr:PD-(D/E)XK nuclease family protein [Anaerolineae bacterium]